MYTITIKIAASGTFYKDPFNPHPSGSGHIWYSLAKDGVTTNSYGFSKSNDGDKSVLLVIKLILQTLLSCDSP